MKYRILISISFALIAAYYTVIFLGFQNLLLRGASDFSSLYAAGTIVRDGQGEHLYDYGVQMKAQEQFMRDLSFRRGPLLYLHPPFELLLYAPLAFLPYVPAFGVWFGCNLLLLFSVPFVVRGSLPGIRERIPAILLVFGFFFPATLVLIHGQDSILVLFLFTWFWAASRRGDDRAAGVSLALASFKPQLLMVVLLAVILQKQWRILRWFLGGAVALLLVSFALVGWNATVGYPHFLYWFERLPPEVSGNFPHTMPNLRGALFTMFGSSLSKDALNLSALAATIGVLGLLAPKLRTKAPGHSLQFATITVLTPLLAFHANTTDFVLLLLPFLLILDYLQTRRPLGPNHWLLGLAVAAAFLVPFAFPGSMPLFCAVLVLAASLLYELASSPPSSRPALREAATETSG